MNKLMLQGESGIGKSTAIQKVIKPYRDQIGGFYVSRLFQKEECIGFRLNKLDVFSSYELREVIPENLDLTKEENIFLLKKDNRWEYDLKVFESYAMRYANEHKDSGVKLMLLDEIGGIELGCEVFRNYLLDLLQAPIPCVGVLKNLERRKHVERVTGIQKREKVQDIAFYKTINKTSEILNMSMGNVEKIMLVLNTFIDKNINCDIIINDKHNLSITI